MEAAASGLGRGDSSRWCESCQAYRLKEVGSSLRHHRARPLQLLSRVQKRGTWLWAPASLVCGTSHSCGRELRGSGGLGWENPGQDF